MVSIIQPPVSVYATATLPQPLEYLRLSPISQSTNDFHQLFRSPIEYVTRTYPSYIIIDTIAPDTGLETGSRAPMTTIELLACTPRCNFC